MKVGRKKPNPRGLLDIHGNVAEWCPDRGAAYNDKTFAGKQPAVGPVVLPDAKGYPYGVRGGSRDDDPELLRNAPFTGFRVARPPTEQEDLRGLKSQVVKGEDHPLS